MEPTHTSLTMMPIPPFLITNSNIIQMRQFVHETLGDHEAMEFYQKNVKKLNGNFVYVFEMQAGTLKWRINKRFCDFQDFSRLIVHRYRRPQLAFPNISEPAAPSRNLISQLHQRLQRWCQQPSIQQQLWTFIEYSQHNYDGVEKFKEMQMYKRSGGRFQQSCVKCGVMFKNWKLRYFIIHSQGLLYKDEQGSIREYLTYGYDFKMRHGRQQTGSSKGIIIQASHRQLTLQALTIFDYLQFIFYVQQGLKRSEYAGDHRFSSFAPIRQECQVQYLVDGENYYRAVALSIEKAEKQIMIAGWWVAPQFQLIRPINEQNQKYRLDNLLRDAATRGVKVNVLVYWESKFLENDSLWTKQSLESLHSNIKVLRHPGTVLPFLWSHHQKLVIIDQHEAFTGGLDLCYARFDTSSHQLYDYNNDMYPGIDYNNIRRKDIVAVRNFQFIQYEKNQHRLPWHDVACRLFGTVVWDLSFHFIQYWNYASHQVLLNNRDVLVREPKSSMGKMKQRLGDGVNRMKEFADKIKYKLKRPEDQPDRFQKYLQDFKVVDSARVILEDATARAGSISNLPQTPIMRKNKSFQNGHLSAPFGYQTNKKGSKSPRAVSSLGHEYHPHDDRHQTLNTRYVKILHNLNEQMHGQQKGEDIVVVPKQVQQFQDGVHIQNRRLSYGAKQVRQFQSAINGSTNVQCQVVRSVGPWSIGCSPQAVQFSIQIAYLELIAKSRNYIYIQNQFFISSCADQENIKNQICNLLVQRILQANERNETFRVYVMIPLLPGFAGQVYDDSATIMKLNLHWEYQTICRGRNSMLSQLQRKLGKDGWKQYIQFLSLRTHARLTQESTPITEIIYIHSKLMIVDDEIVIVGSANINDRSMRGKRDSQVCVIAQDKQTVIGFMNGEKKALRKAAHKLRTQLWAQHFGITDQKQADPVLQENWSMIANIAATNTEIYRTVFNCYPDDYMRDYSDIMEAPTKAAILRYDELVPQIRANVVEFPLRFLENQNLNVRITQKQYIMPITLST